MYTKQQVEQMLEQNLRRLVLIPLLRAMGFQGIHEYHGVNEFGKDIVCWKFDELHQRQNLVLVVKATTVTGESKACADIENQVRQSFGRPYVDPDTGLNEDIHRCWVVSNKPISHDTVERIKAGIGHAVYTGCVSFIDIDALWTRIEEYMPFQANLQKLEEVRHDYITWDSHYRLDARIDGTGIHHTLAEKFPGASQEKPITIKSTVMIQTDTDEGKGLHEALMQFFDAGGRVRIPGSYVNLEYPDFLQGVYPALTDEGFLELGSLPNPNLLFLQCEIVCDDGDCFVLDYQLTCIRSGRKEATLTNDDQPIPFRIELVLHADTATCSFQLSLNQNMSLNVHQLFLRTQFLNCLSKPHTIRFTHLETGIRVASSRNDAGICDAPDPDIMEGLAALDALQARSGRIIMFPKRDLIDEDYRDIYELRILFRTGKLSGTWSNSSASIMVTNSDREEVRQLLEQLANPGGFIFLQEEEIFTLFGEQYPLGPIKQMTLPAKLVNWPEVKALLDQGHCGELSLHFVPRDDGSFTKEFVRWLPESYTIDANVSPDSSREVE